MGVLASSGNFEAPDPSPDVGELVLGNPMVSSTSTTSTFQVKDGRMLTRSLPANIVI